MLYSNYFYTILWIENKQLTVKEQYDADICMGTTTIIWCWHLENDDYISTNGLTSTCVHIQSR